MKRFTARILVRHGFFLPLIALVLVLASQATPAWAQAANTGTVSGIVVDPQGALVIGAAVTLNNKDTGGIHRTTSKDDGHYIFLDVVPGNYNLSVAKTGFTTAKVSDQTVQVGLTTTINVKLQVGSQDTVIEVKATGVELQTLDASVGNVFDQLALEKLPSLNRDATAILLIQPLAQPGFNNGPGAGEGNLTGGGIAGARADQNTFMVDGGDASSNTEGAGGYAFGGNFSATPHASIPTPVESLQEMRVVTNNSNTFARSTGGEVQMVTRSGTNAWHGAVYENNQNEDYNANFWQLNRTGQARPVWIDNRFGGRIGGPIKKDKAFFFLMYEGHDFKTPNPITRLVPSALMRQGIVQYKDDSGVTHKVNLGLPVSGSNPGCGASGTLNCDPRLKGISPVISSVWGLEPTGSNTKEGDGLNTIGFDTSVPVIIRDNFGVAKFDYKLTDRWDLSTSYHYAVSNALSSNQADIGGLIKGDTKGSPVATRPVPTQPRYFTLGATGRLGANLTTDAHFNWLRHWWQWKPVSPFPQVSGTAAALQIYAESAQNGLVPMNIDTQSARSRVWDGKDLTFGDNTTWLKGKHMISFGGEFRHEHFTHTRDDKVVGALTSPVYFADKTSDILTFDPSFLPANCTTTSCVNTWQNAYVATTGMIARASQLLTRASNFSPNPPGTPLMQDTIVDWYNLYFADSWRMTPALTVTLGMGWGAQTPPYELSGRQTIMEDFATKKPIGYADFLNGLASAASAGQPFSPELAFVPVKSTGSKYPYNAEWNDFEPRLSFAWNPSSFLKSIFGDQKSVIRGGYGRYHDRLNGVGLVMTPALGIGFGDTVNCRRVKIGDVCGGAKSDPTNAFRIGVDGSSIPLPTLGSISGALVPGFTADANSPYEILDFRIDPHRKVGVEDTWDLSIQRQLPSNTLFEIGYVGRVAHHLYTVNDLNQVPYMWKAGGQTFAQGFDAVAKQLRANPSLLTNPSGVTAVPWFEAMLGPGGTKAAVTSDGQNFVQGIVTTLWDDLVGLPYLDNQVDVFQTTTSNGNSNYHAGYLSLRKQISHGLLAQVNYTYSHSFDTIGFTQENVFISPSDNFNPHRDYGPSQFDRRHTLNLFYVYDLPFGKGHYLSGGGNNILDKIIGGWSFSGNFTAASGIPLDVINGASCEEFGAGDGSGVCSALLPVKGAPSSSSAHYNPDGSVTAFANPNPNQYNLLLFGDQRTGHGAVRSFPRWNYDAGLSKNVILTERVRMGFGVMAVNVLNHMEFVDPNLDISSGNFGQTSTQYTSPRFLNLNLRVDF
jgi:hypothetical protein